MDINCDLGEGMANDAQIMPHISRCNIACGGHAGNPEIMQRSIELAVKHGVPIGAHPSYPDKDNFGRLSMSLTPQALKETLFQQ
ncbi:MAG TPA: lactam utilization protein LamB, partial [Flavobacteriaceae bacterium]|nr:lactam utilization protein LamB [Flavobacteriaceae bacterium]